MPVPALAGRDLGIMAETGMDSAQHLNPADWGIGDITHLI
jgi:hypothetical protein